MATTNTEAPAYFIGSCARKHVSRYTAAEWAAARIDGGNSCAKYGYSPCHCRLMVTVRAIRVTVTRTECGPRCTGAVGPACDCKCGGENHGANHSAAELVTIAVDEPAVDDQLTTVTLGPVRGPAVTYALPPRQLALLPLTADEVGAQLDLFEAVAEATR